MLTGYVTHGGQVDTFVPETSVEHLLDAKPCAGSWEATAQPLDSAAQQLAEMTDIETNHHHVTNVVMGSFLGAVGSPRERLKLSGEPGICHRPGADIWGGWKSGDLSEKGTDRLRAKGEEPQGRGRAKG